MHSSHVPVINRSSQPELDSKPYEGTDTSTRKKVSVHHILIRAHFPTAERWIDRFGSRGKPVGARLKSMNRASWKNDLIRRRMQVHLLMRSSLAEDIILAACSKQGVEPERFFISTLN